MGKARAATQLAHGPGSNRHRALIIAERDRYGAIDVGWTAPADSGCSASEQDGYGVVSHISLFWVPVSGECERYRMIVAAGLMLALSTTKAVKSSRAENSGVRGQRPAERWCWRWPGSPSPAVVMMMMAIRGTVADRSGVRRSTRPPAGERAVQR